MIGERMMIYDVKNDMFLTGFRAGEHANEAMPPTWGRLAKDALVLTQVSMAYKIKEQLGAGIHVITDDEAMEIEWKRDGEEMV